MPAFMVTVEAKPSDKLVSDPQDPKITGYFQTIGVTAKDEKELQRIVKEYLFSDLKSELISIDEIWVPDFSNSDSDIKDQVGNLTEVGVWYTSGRVFYGPEEE